MIKGKIRGNGFEFDDGEITSNDEETEETLREMFKLLLMDYELKDGLPELIFLSQLEKFGAKELKYEPTDEQYDFIGDGEELDKEDDESIVKDSLYEKVKRLFKKY